MLRRRAGAVVVCILIFGMWGRARARGEDPLPAGLEPVSALFTTSSRAAELALGLHNDDYTHREIYDDRVAFAITSLAPGVHHFSYMARAVTPGRFVVPVAKAEEMYHPETFGRCASGQFEVVAK